MASSIPNLWSDDINVDVLSPSAILRAQADLLKQRTRGLIQAEVVISKDKDSSVQIRFDLIAPALNHYRHRILLATHQDNFVYPIHVEAECFENSGLMSELRSDFIGRGDRTAETEQEFIELVSAIFHSRQVKSVLHSLIARSNEERASSGAHTEFPDDDGAE